MKEKDIEVVTDSSFVWLTMTRKEKEAQDEIIMVQGMFDSVVKIKILESTK